MAEPSGISNYDYALAAKASTVLRDMRAGTVVFTQPPTDIGAAWVAVLDELDARRASLKARIGKEERARDTRRKVLLGALVLDRLERSHDEEFAKRLRDWLARELPGFLTRDVDRTLLADLIATHARANAALSRSTVAA